MKSRGLAVEVVVVMVSGGGVIWHGHGHIDIETKMASDTAVAHIWWDDCSCNIIL